MYNIDKIHEKNPDLKPCRHELIWSFLGKYKVYLRIDEKEANFIPFSVSLDTIIDRNEINRCFEYLAKEFQRLFFYEKRGVFESLFIIERDLQRNGVLK